ncbi:MAG: hypothetical protein K0R21_759 [Anaerocolumna sp.]|jgi:hypothetical protein|nr:hypothetical protein [Anaerocolumna sp.]
MYYDHSKRSYYRFPSKNSITDFETHPAYYFPEKNSVADDFTFNYSQNNHYNDETTEHSQGMDL